MDGKDLLRRLRNLMDEDSDSGWLDTQSSYDFLYEAAKQIVDRTGCLKSTQEITTVAETNSYNLNPDFSRLYVKNSSNKFYIVLNDGSNNHYLTFKDYEDIVYESNSSSVAIPSRFSIIDKSSLSQISSTATSAGASSGGQCTLTDSTAPFANVNPGAIVHNTTDGSDGVVLSKTSTSAIETALFGGTNNDWSSSDAYIIQPQGRYQLILDPTPSTAGYTITVYYIQIPDPVYSDYGIYRFSNQYKEALVKYAYWLYKYRDGAPDAGDAMYRYFEDNVGKYSYFVNRGLRGSTLKVNYKARR